MRMYYESAGPGRTQATPSPRIETPTGHTHLRIATFGEFSFDQPDFVAAVHRIVETEQTFWGDGQPDFLVTLAPLRAPGGQAYTGTGLGDAFAGDGEGGEIGSGHSGLGIVKPMIVKALARVGVG